MEAIVLYPTNGMGHLISMVELGKLILTQQPSLSIHILITGTPFSAASIPPYLNSLSSTFPSLKFHHLPKITLSSSTTTAHHLDLTLEVIRLTNPLLRQALLSISETYSVKAFILDFFCTEALSVTSQLHIPSYYYFSTGAGCLALFLYFNTLHENTNKSFKDLNIVLQIPGIPPLLASDMPQPILDRRSKAYQSLLDLSRSFCKSAGIIVNDFDKLDEKAIVAIRDGACAPDFPIPPLYCIGPLIAAGNGGDSNKTSQVPECLTWLDSQPKKSVVFLCFGSLGLGLFSKDQLCEIAIGLERSGQRFLWVVRNPHAEGDTAAIKAESDPDLTSLLPRGFLDRTKERGLVVKSWAPQVLVLNHESVGGFATHCGWNSILEAVRAGVPMIAWPLYAEQRLNKVLIVEEMKIALPLEESENGFVSAAEVEKRVAELMESEEGELVRKRTIYMKNAAEAALSRGGSSRVALSQFLQSWK